MKELHIWRTEDNESHEIFTGSEEEFLSIKEFYRKEWRLNGRQHREDGPAYIWSDESQAWWQNGNLHRTDGPAIIWPDGRKSWHIDGFDFYYFFNSFFPMKNYIKDKFPGE